MIMIMTTTMNMTMTMTMTMITITTTTVTTTMRTYGAPGDDVPIPLDAAGAAIAQFMLGAWLWVAGQQVGSLACTGLGYWIVFDAFGVAVGKVLPVYLASGKMRDGLRRSYGNGRLETVVLFAQAVYLMFSAVYVFKETVEHLLLSAGEGHHHHPGDETVVIFGIDFPVILLFTTFLSLVGTALVFENNTKLVTVTGNQLPSLSSILNPSRYRYSAHATPVTPFARIWANPYSLAPVALALAILVISFIIPASQHRGLDLVLAAAEAIAMFQLAYPACVTIGTVLLQTSPPRGHASGRMEAFLRAMREIERHPQVLHLPPPHIWQLTPSTTDPAKALVVTLELRVAPELADEDVLRLTRWAWERCTYALGQGPKEEGGGGGGGVTVGIVRG
ncbi:hypothetical protein EVG20_g7766 [Dentipellis fragilis]|uniref:Cation efflux protein cytoplasmic domain-containing protein n=1 Tax=Dentipellis fragilis TaxID=205917 RepID=A0A4Y9YDJ9_9AGAM|nr:hypothetical protein EVG20_g7766 [Dentipellis fragilis]